MKEKGKNEDDYFDFGKPLFRLLFKVFVGLIAFFVVFIAISLPYTDQWEKSTLFRWQFELWGTQHYIPTVLFNIVVMSIALLIAVLTLYICFRILFAIIRRTSWYKNRVG